MGQNGQGWSAGLPSEGLFKISKLVTDEAPWRLDVPIQSDPVSPPPITITFLFLAEIKSPNSLKPSTYSLFNFKKVKCRWFVSKY